MSAAAAAYLERLHQRRLAVQPDDLPAVLELRARGQVRVFKDGTELWAELDT